MAGTNDLQLQHSLLAHTPTLVTVRVSLVFSQAQLSRSGYKPRTATPMVLLLNSMVPAVSQGLQVGQAPAAERERPVSEPSPDSIAAAEAQAAAAATGGAAAAEYT